MKTPTAKILHFPGGAHIAESAELEALNASGVGWIAFAEAYALAAEIALETGNVAEARRNLSLANAAMDRADGAFAEARGR